MLRLLAHSLSGLRSIPRTSSLLRAMSSAAPPPFKPFNLALIQLGQVGTDKQGTS